ncbi:MAG: ABC transporter ATP-binding protein [Clostridium sp.]|uniref:ABC transporter ATP-binding protein n=1 Tax=Clostridium sp. TaxID=1506 RepID=UPI003D6D34A4
MELKIKNLSKKYNNNVWALKDLNLELKSGVCGLLGPNGAGKSTMMRIISTITKATEGEILWNGKDIGKEPNAIRKVLGYLPQDFGVYPNLNAVEFLEYMAGIKGINGRDTKKRIEELLDLVNLRDAKKRALSGYSGGMKQRVGIAQALLNDPEILIVDEPTVGLDPEERVRFRNLISDLSINRIVIFSTHIVSDIEATAASIAIISKGQLLTHSTPEGLLNEVEGKVWEWVVPENELEIVRNNWIISGTIRRNDGVHIRVVSPKAPKEGLLSIAPNLEDAYLYFISNNKGEIR